MYDVIIIGAGAAGITSAIYAARAKLKFEIISKDVGGLTLWSSDIENYTGFHKLSGLELVEKFKEHMADYDINVKDSAVTKVEKLSEGFKVITDSQEYETKTVIVATGHTPRRLTIPGASEFEKKGLAYCATCDGPFFAGKDVAVIGGGDAALDAANTLLPIAKKIIILNINSELTGTDLTLKNNVVNSDNVEVINNCATKEIFGEQFVKGLKYEVSGEEKQLDVEGIFVEIGSVPSVDFIEGLVDQNDHKEIIVDKQMQTSVPGIYCAGDVNDIPGKQAIIAAGDGSKALLSAFGFISKK